MLFIHIFQKGELRGFPFIYVQTQSEHCKNGGEKSHSVFTLGFFELWKQNDSCSHFLLALKDKNNLCTETQLLKPGANVSIAKRGQRRPVLPSAASYGSFLEVDWRWQGRNSHVVESRPTSPRGSDCTRLFIQITEILPD